MGIGKMSQKYNQSISEFLQDVHGLTDLLLDATLDISALHLLTEDTVSITYKKKEMFVPRNRNASPIIGGILTSHARIILDQSLR